MRNEKKDTIRVFVEKTTKDRYQMLYPNTMSRYLRNALKIACENKTLFQSIFFEEV